MMELERKISVTGILKEIITNMFGGGPFYKALIAVLSIFIITGIYAWNLQLTYGLIVTGMRDPVSWGLYISNFTFLVGIAAAAVAVVAGGYIFKDNSLKKVTIPAEILAISAIIMVMLFVLVDLGRPERVIELLPIIGTPNFPSSMMVWDFLVLSTYLILNIVAVTYSLACYRAGREPSGKVIMPIVGISLPFAISIHTVTAFIYQALVARPYWHSAILAPRFIASALASGPALLILILLIIHKFTDLDIPRNVFNKLALIILLSLATNLFLFLSEVFTVLWYSNREALHLESIMYALIGYKGHINVAFFTWVAIALDVAALMLLINPTTRSDLRSLVMASIYIIFGIWLEKGMGTIIPGFIPTPIGELWEYWPTIVEWAISIGIYALGFLVFALLLKGSLPIILKYHASHVEDRGGEIR